MNKTLTVILVIAVVLVTMSPAIAYTALEASFVWLLAKIILAIAKTAAFVLW